MTKFRKDDPSLPKVTIGSGTGMLRDLKVNGVKVGTVLRTLNIRNQPDYFVHLLDGRSANEPRLDWARDTARKMVADPSLNPSEMVISHPQREG